MNQANDAELHKYVNNLNGRTHIPLGYTHTLIGKTFIKTLIDSGNLFGTICSEKLAKQLNFFPLFFKSWHSSHWTAGRSSR